MSKSLKKTKLERCWRHCKTPGVWNVCFWHLAFIYHLIKGKLCLHDWCLLHFIFLSTIGGKCHYFPHCFLVLWTQALRWSSWKKGGGFCPWAAVETRSRKSWLIFGSLNCEPWVLWFFITRPGTQAIIKANWLMISCPLQLLQSWLLLQVPIWTGGGYDNIQICPQVSSLLFCLVDVML